LAQLVGTSPPMRVVRELLLRAAASDATLLLAGETGTGKGLCAELVHRMGARRHGPLVVVDGVLLQDELALSQLFGHRRGAFTGATESQEGMVAAADGGTLFIDEIADASPRVQAALLRLLDERRYQMVGDTRWRSVDCRLICATRRRLSELVAQGSFRDDLMWRIRCIEITLPPLRDRQGDVLALTRVFLDELGRREGRQFRLDDGAEVDVRHHTWPGNVRELRQRLERAVTLAADGVITAETLGLPATGIRPAGSLPDLERRALLDALQRAAGNQRHAARLLGIPESSFRSKLRRHGLGRQ